MNNNRAVILFPLCLVVLAFGGCVSWRSYPGDGSLPVIAKGDFSSRIPKIIVSTDSRNAYNLQSSMMMEAAFRKAGYEPHFIYIEPNSNPGAELTSSDVFINLKAGDETSGGEILWAIVSGLSITAIPMYGSALEDLPVKISVMAAKNGKTFSKEYHGDIRYLMWLPLLPVFFQPVFVTYPTVQGELKEDSRGEFSVVFRTTYEMIKDLRTEEILK